MSDTGRDAPAPSGELPAARRVTPDAVDSYFEPRPGAGFSVASLVLGAATAWLVFPVFWLALAWDPNGTWLEGTGGVAVVLIVLMYSFLPAACLGLPLGVLVAMRMRRVTHQWWHVAAFAGAGAVVGAVVSLLLGGTAWSMFAPAAALSAATGRLALWRRFRPRGAGD